MDATRTELRRVNADGSGDTALGVAGWDPAWSPDGTRIAFARAAAGGYPQVFVADLVSGQETQITHGTGAISPDWSPDGTLLAYVQGPLHYPVYEVYVARTDGSGERRVTFELTDGAWVLDASWSPDGRRIAFARTHQGTQTDLYSIGADGSGRTQLTDNYVGPPAYTRIDDEAPAWSPDGASTVFVRDADGPTPLTLFVMGSDGSGERSLVPGDHPAWQPLPLQTGEPRNAAQACKAEYQSLGAEAFRQRYGGGANAHGKCVSGGSQK
jgi:Tol biopolymer transport system component